MQIQSWEGAAWGCAEAVRQGATPDRMSPEAGCCEEGSWRARLKRLEKEIHSTARHRGTERVETREEFELDRVASCSSRDHRRRTKLDFSSGESFDEHHPPATLGASPEIAGTGGGDLLRGLRCRAEQLETKWQGGGTSAIGQEAEVSDAHEPFGEQMQQEAAQEFITR